MWVVMVEEVAGGEWFSASPGWALGVFTTLAKAEMYSARYPIATRVAEIPVDPEPTDTL
jgi:hypothetical protein